MSEVASKQNIENIVGELAQAETDTYISWADFEKEYLQREDEFKYEWLDGTIEKTYRPMNRTQLLIQRNIIRLFMKSVFAGEIEGDLLAEGDLFFKNHHRRPDLCWLTAAQLDSLHAGNKDVPMFVIEVISQRDSMNQMVGKMKDYRRANVQTVWHIFPEFKEVHVYRGKNLAQMEVFVDDEKFSAAPAVSDFELKVNDLFAKASENV